MGEGFVCNCENCGYEFTAYLDTGMFFPLTYRETVEKMKSREMGAQGQEFFKEYPQGAIDCRNVVGFCKKCGEYHQIVNQAMYTPKEWYNPNKIKNDSIWSVAAPFAGAIYVTKSELDRYYDKYDDYYHVCPGCGEPLEIIEDFMKQLDAETLDCPKCGMRKLKRTGIIMWD